MTVHAVWAVCATSQVDDTSLIPVPSPAPPSWDAALIEERIVNNVLDSLTEVLPSQGREAFLANTEPNPDLTGTDYISSTRRFDFSHSKSDVLDEFEAEAVIDAEWYGVRYHECDHDAGPQERTGCPEWTSERSSGTVPPEV